MLRTSLVALATLGLVTTACGDDAAEPDGTSASTAPAGDLAVDGRTFLSTEVTGHDLVPGSTIRIAFDAGRLSISAGCNSMSGGYTLEGDRIMTGALATTEMACEQPLMDQDVWIAEMFAGGPAAALSGDELTLTSGGVTITMLDRVVADPDRALEGTTWTVTGVITGDAVQSGWGDAVATLTIAGGTASVEAGCNSGSAEVTLGEGTITFAPLALTKKMCDDQAMQLEQAVTTVFDGETTYEIQAGSMTIMHGADGLELSADV